MERFKFKQWLFAFPYLVYFCIRRAQFFLNCFELSAGRSTLRLSTGSKMTHLVQNVRVISSGRFRSLCATFSIPICFQFWPQIRQSSHLSNDPTASVPPDFPLDPWARGSSIDPRHYLCQLISELHCVGAVNIQGKCRI